MTYRYKPDGTFECDTLEEVMALRDRLVDRDKAPAPLKEVHCKNCKWTHGPDSSCRNHDGTLARGVYARDLDPSLIQGIPVCEGCYVGLDTTLADLTTPPLPTCQRCTRMPADRLVAEATAELPLEEDVCKSKRPYCEDHCLRSREHPGPHSNGAGATWWR